MKRDSRSKPGSPYRLTDRQVQQARIALAQAADLLRMEGRFRKAAALYREAARHADGMAAAHLIKMAQHCAGRA